MIPGTLGWLLMLSAAALIAFGWRHELARSFPALPLLLFFPAWIAAGWCHFSAGEWRFDGHPALLAAICLLLLLRPSHGWSIGQGLSVGVLLVSLYFLSQEIFESNPAWMPVRSTLASAVLMGGLVPFLARDPSRQLATFTLAFLTGFALRLMLADPGVRWMGGGEFSDAWWLGALCARLVSELRLGAEWMWRRLAAKL